MLGAPNPGISATNCSAVSKAACESSKSSRSCVQVCSARSPVRVNTVSIYNEDRSKSEGVTTVLRGLDELRFECGRELTGSHQLGLQVVCFPLRQQSFGM